jgi:hypothetical protein
MVNWRALVVNALWVFGLSSLLAGLCIKSYIGLLATVESVAHVEHVHKSLARSAPIALWAGLSLIGISLAFLSTTTWERVAWVLVLALSLKAIVQQLRTTMPSSSPLSAPGHDE